MATDGNFSYILHKEQTTGGLLAEISEQNPDIILLDYHLANGLKGDRLAEVLKLEGVGAKLIGFSSETEAKEHFKKVGVEAVEKDGGNPKKSLKEIAGLI